MLKKRLLKKANQALAEMICYRERDPHKVVSHCKSVLKHHGFKLPKHKTSNKTCSAVDNMSNTHVPIYLESVHTPETNIHLVGKGITFDTGGHNLKSDMKGMFFDKNGACLVLILAAILQCSFSVGFQSNDIHANLLPDSIHKIGDHQVLITDTDAEGRLLLADLISRIDGEGKHIIATGTLTGHACYVLGDEGGALVHSSNPDIREVVVAFADQLEMWSMPYNSKHKETAISCNTFGATIRNYVEDVPGSQAVYYFLEEFVPEENTLTFVDIAPMMMDKDGNPLVWGIKQLIDLINIQQDFKSLV